MVEMFHGIDRHKKYSTISVLNRDGEEVEFHQAVWDLKAYVKRLGPEDAVVLEASTGSFWWADQVEAQGAACYIINPYRFKIISESWNKTDKRDARNMAKALWVHEVTGEFLLPTVSKPSATIRELRRLFAQYALMNRQIVMLKNAIQAVLADNGVVVAGREKNHALDPEDGIVLMEEYELTAASTLIVREELELLSKVKETKRTITRAILSAGEPLKDQVMLLLTIRGITPLSALAFLADVGDIRRFKSLKKMNAYLGLVSRCDNSGGKERHGHISRESRKLTRTLLTQSVVQLVEASPSLKQFYQELKEKKGAGKGRIAVIRKLCGIMRRMLLSGEEFRNKDEVLFAKKVRAYEKALERGRDEKKTA